MALVTEPWWYPSFPLQEFFKCSQHSWLVHLSLLPPRKLIMSESAWSCRWRLWALFCEPLESLVVKVATRHWKLPGGRSESVCVLLLHQKNQRLFVDCLIAEQTSDKLTYGKDGIVWLCHHRTQWALFSTACSAADVPQEWCLICPFSV